MRSASGQLGIAVVALLVAFASSLGSTLGAASALRAQVEADESAAAVVGTIEQVDRIVAIVDDDPILASDIDQVIGLGLAARGGDDDESLRRRILDQLIEERLRFHEIDRFGFTEIPLDEVDRAYDAIRERFGSATAFDTRLTELGLEPEGMRQLVARQILVLTYVEERLGSRVFVSLDDIRQYFSETLPSIRSDKTDAIRRVMPESW